MDRCVKIEHARILGGLNWAGVNTGIIFGPKVRVACKRLLHGGSDKFGFDTRCLHAGQIPDARDRCARPADLPDDVVRVRQRGSRRKPVQSADFRQRLLAHLQSDGCRARGTRRFAGGRTRRASPPRPAWPRRWSRCSRSPRTATTSSRRARSTVELIRSSPSRLPSSVSKPPSSTLRIPRISGALSSRTPRPSMPRRSATRSSTSLDIAAVAAIAHDAGVPLVIDNTLASPYLCRPIEHGADIVIHSVTKYLGGHGTTMGGVVVESGKFDWGNGKFPQMTTPSRGYHGVIFHEIVRRFRLHHEGAHGDDAHARTDAVAVFGILAAARASRRCTCACRAIASRRLRSQRISRSIRASNGSTIRCCRGNGEESRARRYLPHGAGGILTFGVRGGARSGGTFHRIGAVPVAPRQCRRRQDAGHSPGIDHASPTRRG